MKDCNTCVYSYLLDTETGSATDNPCKSCVDYDHYVMRVNHVVVEELTQEEKPVIPDLTPEEAEEEEPGEEYDHDELEVEG